MALIKSIAGNEICDQTARNTFSSYKKSSYLSANGAGKSASYIQICTITVKSGYVNAPITIGVTDRGKLPTRIFINFSSVNNTDPSLGSFKRDGTSPAYIAKIGTSTWALYIAKSEAWADIHVNEYDNPYGGNVAVTWTGVNTDSLPSGYVTASVLYDVKMTDDGAGNVTIKTL